MVSSKMVLRIVKATIAEARKRGAQRIAVRCCRDQDTGWREWLPWSVRDAIERVFQVASKNLVQR